MIGQCVFCSWYGVRLRRAAFLDGTVLYHPHCVRVGLDSPDPADRVRAEQIFRAEMPRLVRDRFWEFNPPNRTANPAVGIRDISAHDFDQLLREQSLGTGESARQVLTGESSRPNSCASEAVQIVPSFEQSAPFEQPRPFEQRAPFQRPSQAASPVQQPAPSPPAVAPLEQPALPASTAAKRRRPRAPKSQVDRAVELIARLSDRELEEFRERLAQLVQRALAAPKAA